MSGGNAVLHNGASVSGGALVLDGVDDYAELPVTSTLRVLTDVSVEMWVTWTGARSWQACQVSQPRNTYESRVGPSHRGTSSSFSSRRAKPESLNLRSAAVVTQRLTLPESFSSLAAISQTRCPYFSTPTTVFREWSLADDTIMTIAPGRFRVRSASDLVTA